MPAGLPPIRTGWIVAAAGFRRYGTYRQAIYAGAFTNTVFGIIKISILFAVADAAGGAVTGYDKAALSTYTWVTQGLLAAVFMYGWNEVGLRVRTGDVAVDLARPAHPVWLWLCTDLGRAGQALLFRFLAPLVVGALVFGLRVPQRWETVPLFVISAVLGVVVSFGGRLLSNLAAFWLVDTRGVLTLYMVLSSTLCGLLVPIPFFPGWLRTLAYCTPWPWIMQVPSDIAVERHSTAVALGAVAAQAAYAAALLALTTWVLSRGTRKLVLQGG